MSDEKKKKKYDPTKKFGRLLPQSKTTLKQRLAKSDAYFKLDPKVRSKIRKKKYDSLSDTQKKTLQGIKTAAEVASYFTPGIGLRLAVPVMRGIQAAKTGFKVGNKTYKTLKEATDAKNKLKKVVPSKLKTRDPKTGKLKPTPDEKATKRATQSLKTKEAKNLTAQQKALKTKQDQTTKNLKAASNISTAGGTVLAGKKLTENKNKKPTKPDNVDRSKLKNQLSKTASNILAEKNKVTKVKKDPVTITKKVKKSPAKVTKKVEKGPAKSVAEAQKRGLSTFTNKAGKKLAAVSKEQLDKSGLSLRDYLNKQKGLTRKNSTTKKKAGGKVFRRGGGKALRGMGKAIYSNKMY